ncbi:MAG: YtxH domain-containing protein, partial [Chloroflexi bacterium]|nr:YtxH domain-containing protein [Chloroflexota bacterium]
MAPVKKSGSFILGLLLGSLIGAALALLLAPDRGAETRRRVRSRAQPGVEKIRDVATRLTRRGEAPSAESEEAQMPESGTTLEGDMPEEVGNASESAGAHPAYRPGELEEPEDGDGDPAGRRGRGRP